jgi:hypothetical protein
MTERAHAYVGPSAWDSWSVCAAYPWMNEQFPSEPTEYSAHGECQHKLRERCLNEGLDADHFIGETVSADGFEFEVDAEWSRWLQPGIDWIREQSGELYVEHRVDLSTWMPGQFGTLDTGIILPELIIINDYKGGKGINVEVEGNGQLMLYALGFWDKVARHKTEATEFMLVIDQPRIGPGQKEWRVSLDQLLKFGEIAALAFQRTQVEEPEFGVSTKGCQMCPGHVNAACPAVHRFCLELIGMDPDTTPSEVPVLPQIDHLSSEQRSHLIEHAGMLRKWLAGIHNYQLSEAIAGNPTPGLKAVATLGDRSWRDEAEAEAYWTGKMPAREVFNKKLKSPAQMERVAGTRNWSKAQVLIVRPEGKPALVPEYDPRPALAPLTDMLDDLDDPIDDLI